MSNLTQWYDKDEVATLRKHWDSKNIPIAEQHRRLRELANLDRYEGQKTAQYRLRVANVGDTANLERIAGEQMYPDHKVSVDRQAKQDLASEDDEQPGK